MLVQSIKQGRGYIRGYPGPNPLQLPRPYNGTCTHQHQTPPPASATTRTPSTTPTPKHCTCTYLNTTTSSKWPYSPKKIPYGKNCTHLHQSSAWKTLTNGLHYNTCAHKHQLQSMANTHLPMQHRTS